MWDGSGVAGEVVTGVLRCEHHLDLVQRLEPEVDLLEHELREQLDEAREVGDPGRLRRPLGGVGGQRHRSQVVAELLAQPGTAHLHDDRRAVGQLGRVHLADRRRPNGTGSKSVSILSSGTSKVSSKSDSAMPVGSGGDRVAAPAEGLHPLIGQQALCGGDELPELDVGGAAGLDDLLHVLDGGALQERAGPEALRARPAGPVPPPAPPDGAGAADRGERLGPQRRPGQRGGLGGDPLAPGPRANHRRAKSCRPGKSSTSLLVEHLDHVGQRRPLGHGATPLSTAAPT